MLNIARSFLSYMLSIFLFYKYIICNNEPFFDCHFYFSFIGVKFVIIQILAVQDGGNSSGSRKRISLKKKCEKKAYYHILWKKHLPREMLIVLKMLFIFQGKNCPRVHCIFIICAV